MAENVPPKASSETASRGLRRMIRRRKIADGVFAALGIVLVVASLSVLVALFGRLAADGFGRLWETHEVRPNGYAPARFDIIGALRRGDDGTVILQRDSLVISGENIDAAKLAPLEGKAVLAEGRIPSPGQRVMEVEAVSALPEGPPPRYSRQNLAAVLRRGDEGWILEPLPLRIDVAAAEAEPLLGRRVCLTPARPYSDPLRIESMDRLVRQTFFGAMPSRDPARAGIKSAIVGSILVVGLTMLLAVPVGVAAGVYLEEYARKNWLTAAIEINIANLAGVPSIVWGLMALGLLVYQLHLGRSILTGGITLALLVLPMVIMATRESVRAIPGSIREASYACGASRWQTVWHHILPYSLGGVLTGSIISLSRAIGETAPLITVGALTYIAFLPEFSLSDPLGWARSEFTVMPIQMFNWVSRPEKEFNQNAAAAGLVLLVLTLSMNAVAIVLRYRLRRKIQW